MVTMIKVYFNDDGLKDFLALGYFDRSSKRIASDRNCSWKWRTRNQKESAIYASYVVLTGSDTDVQNPTIDVKKLHMTQQDLFETGFTVRVENMGFNETGRSGIRRGPIQTSRETVKWDFLSPKPMTGQTHTTHTLKLIDAEVVCLKTDT